MIIIAHATTLDETSESMERNAEERENRLTRMSGNGVMNSIEDVTELERIDHGADCESERMGALRNDQLRERLRREKRCKRLT